MIADNTTTNNANIAKRVTGCGNLFPINSTLSKDRCSNPFFFNINPPKRFKIYNSSIIRNFYLLLQLIILLKNAYKRCYINVYICSNFVNLPINTFYLKRFQNLVKIGLLNIIHISYESPYNINMRLMALNKLISDYYTILCLSYTTYETYHIKTNFLCSNIFLYCPLKTKLL